MDKEIMLIEKFFQGKQVRTVWSKEEEKFYVSVVDMIGVLTESAEPRKYWNWLRKMVKNV